MLRKRIVKVLPSLSVPEPGEMDIAATAAVQVTSEDPTHPIEHVFDNRRGPGEAVGLQQSRVSKRCCWRSILPRPFTRPSWKSRNRKSVVRKNSSCLCRTMADRPTVSCAVKNTTSARLARPLSEKLGGAG